MTGPSKRRRIAEALEVSWTPSLAERTRRRIREALERRRRRRRAGMVVLVSLLLGGISFAFTSLAERRHPRPLARAAASSTASPSRPAAAPPPRKEEAPAPAAEPVVRRQRPSSTKTAVASTPAPSVAALFAAADAARLAGRPEDAVAPLRRILDGFPGDRRAALAAFELGRVLADDLHDPVAAAPAFARARDLDPTGPLAAAAAARASEARRAARERSP